MSGVNYIIVIHYSHYLFNNFASEFKLKLYQIRLKKISKQYKDWIYWSQLIVILAE